MPSKRIPKKKLACATKETKEGKQYTTCYEKKVTPARTFKVKKKVPVPEKKAPAKKPAAKKPAAKKPAAKSEVSMATPPIVTANEAGAKKLLKFMTKVSKEKEQRAGITSPALGWEYHSFQFKKLTGGDLEFIESGKRHELPLKKIMSFLKKVKSGTYPYPNNSPPDFYKKYLHLLDFNSMVKVSKLY